MADITIPGVTDKYGTTNLVEQLMEVERIPLTREQEKLESYKNEQAAWRSVNSAMSSLRESVRSLYSFDNPFNTKIATSTEEDAITASPSRDAEIGSFRIKVEQIAEADRFLSGEIDNSDKQLLADLAQIMVQQEGLFTMEKVKISQILIFQGLLQLLQTTAFIFFFCHGFTS